MEDSREKLVRYLQDAHAAEVGIEKALKGFVDDTDDPSLQSLFREHAAITKTQADRLEMRLRALGEEPSGGKGLVNSLMANASELLQGAHDEYDKATQNLIKAYATEHLERGMYTSLIAYANACGDNETAIVAQQILAEEEKTADRIFPLISQHAMAACTAASGKRAYTS